MRARQIGVFAFVFVHFAAVADAPEADVTLVRKLPFVGYVQGPTTTYAQILKQNSEFIVAADGEFDHLPKKISEAEFARLGTAAAKHFASVVRDHRRLDCGDLSAEVARVNGETSVLHLESDGEFSLKVYAPGASVDAGPSAEHRLGFIPWYASSSWPQCSGSILFGRRCAIFAPVQILRMLRCDRDLPCRGVKLFREDLPPGHILQDFRDVAEIFGKGEEALAQIYRARDEFDDHKSSAAVYRARIQEFTQDIKFKARSAMVEMQKHMMLLAELERACASPSFRRSVAAKGILQIIDTPTIR